MSGEIFIQALSDIDDRYLEEVFQYHAPVRRIIRPVLRGLAAACLAIIICFSALLAVSVEAREMVFGWIKEQVETFTKYSYKDQPEDTETGDFPRYTLTEVPEGFALLMDTKDIGGQMVIYVSETQGYLYLGVSDNGNLYLQHDGHTVHHVLVHETDADLYIPEASTENSAIVWMMDDLFFFISAAMSPEELVYYAEHVAPLEEEWPEYCLSRIPEGYRKIEENNISDQRILLYTDGRNLLTLSCGRDNAPVYYEPPKNAVEKTVMVHGQPADLYICPDGSEAGAVIWSEDGILFCISGFFGEDKLPLLAESVHIRPKRYDLTHIPEGFALTGTQDNGEYSISIYETADGRILRFIYGDNDMDASDFIQEDNHNCRFEIIAGYPTDFYIARDSAVDPSAIVWYDDDTTFIIDGYFDKETLTAMAESVARRPTDE